jgi:uncharacterized protein YeaO (DUF488 family)
MTRAGPNWRVVVRVSEVYGERPEGQRSREARVGDVRIWRIYDREPPPGRVFFVERLWPRGIRRDELPAQAWVKDVAPSSELRRWYGHDPEKWVEFRRRYTRELDANPEAWRPLLDAAAAGDVALVYSARDETRNSAAVLRDYLCARLPRT